MDLTELRIGNIIRHNVKSDGETETGFCEPNEDVISEDDMNLFLITEQLKDAEPVKITEDWLFKFNWKYQDRDVNRSDKVKERFYISPYFGEQREYWFELQINTLFGHSFMWLNWDVGGGRHHVHMPEGHKMEYVHQLQNVYWAMAGVDMKLKSVGKEKV